MAVFFNGVDLASNFFNGIDLTNIFFNRVEVFTADEPEFLLDFDGVEDFYIIQAEERDFNIPATGDFSFGGFFLVPVDIPPADRALIGRSSTDDSATWRYQLQYQGGGQLRFYTNGTNFIQIPNFIQDFGGQRLQIEAKWGATDYEILINGNIGAKGGTGIRPTDNSDANFFIGCTGNGTGTGIGNYLATQVHNWFFGDEFTPCNEGEGLTVTGDQGTTGTIFRESQWREQEEFKLAFTIDSDDLRIDPVTNWVTVNDIDAKLITNIRPNGTDQNLFSTGSSNSTGVIRLSLNSSNQVTMLINNSTGTTVASLVDPTIRGDSDDLEFEFVNSTILINGALLFDFTSSAAETMNSFQTYFFGRLSNSDIWQSRQELQTFFAGGELFPLNEGVGLTVLGDQGTTGVLSNETMWQTLE